MLGFEESVKQKRLFGSAKYFVQKSKSWVFIASSAITLVIHLWLLSRCSQKQHPLRGDPFAAARMTIA